MHTDRNGKGLKAGDKVTIIGTVEEIMPNGKCIVRVDLRKGKTKIIALYGENMAARDPEGPPPQGPGDGPEK